MLSGTTRKLINFDEDMPERTRRKLQIGIQLPPSPSSQPPLTTNNQDSEQTMFLYIHPPSPHHPPPPPPPPPQFPPPPATGNQDSDPQTELTMYSYGQSPPPQLPLPLLRPPQLPPVTTAITAATADHAHAPRRNRRKPTHAPGNGKSPTIPPPYPWATDRRAKVRTMEYLSENLITTISGDVECKRCQRTTTIEYNLEQKFKEISDYVESHIYDFRDRAPTAWMSPTLPKCSFCNQENSMKPVMKKKKTINWLFLFLGQMLGCCTLEQLKYFCKHTGNHRTGAKDRVLFLTYLELFKQISPDRWSG